MGIIRNRLTIVHDFDKERIENLRQLAIKEFSEFIYKTPFITQIKLNEIDGNFVSPILKSLINCEYTFIIMGDCSKIGWYESDMWEKFRNEWCEKHKSECTNMVVLDIGEAYSPIIKKYESEETMENETELKKCPFCGTKAQIDYIDNGNNGFWYSVVCSENMCRCGVSNTEYSFNTEKEAIESWNRRI